MLKIYEYLFYKLYLFFLIIDKDMPKFLSIMALCWLMFFNVITVLGKILTFYPELGYSINKTIIGILLGTIIFLIHFFYFSWKDRYLTIIERYKIESEKSKLFGTIGVLFYIGLSTGICLFYSVPKIQSIY